MRRRVLVLVAVLVVGAWTCQVPTSGGGQVAGPTTTGLATQFTGEPWHYVGDTDEPAFNTGWSNASATYYPEMAYRLREPGVVDIVGCVTTDGTSGSIFTLPEGYQPINSHGIMPLIRQRSGDKSGQLLVVNDTGDVIPTDSSDSGDVLYISGSFFLDSPTAIS